MTTLRVPRAPRASRALQIAAAASFALLPGCSSSPALRYYVLAPVAQAPAQPAAAPVSVIIRDLRLPQYLDRREIVTRGSDHRLQLSENELWAGNVREDMTRVLAENLGRILGSERVIAAPRSLRLQPDFRLEVEVLRFEREPDGRIGLSARWWLMRGTDAALLASPAVTLSGAQLGEGASYEALVAAMSTVYGELAQAIARSIRARAAGGS